jgi:glycosyltransferase involved in cell wall biosynthesis
MKTTIKVLFYEPYPMGLGGNFLTQRLILERLDRVQFNPIIVSPIEGVALEEFQKMGIECVVIPPPGKLDRYGGTIIRSGILGRMKTALDLLRYNLKLARFLREKQINVVYANCVRAEMSIGLAARLARVPSLLYIKGELANPIIDRICFILAEKIVFQCKANRDDRYPICVKMLLRKIDIVENGIDKKIINTVCSADKSSIRIELGIEDSSINVAVVGQLYRAKGQHLVLEALSNLVVNFQNIRLYLIGDHVIDEYRSYKMELEQIIARNGLEEYVRFTGWRKDALEIISLMDVVIHPSLAEGFPFAVLEAMALGKPVIASKVGGLREAIKDGKNGFLVERGDVETITQRWWELLINPELRIRIGQAAHETVFDKYLIDDKVDKLVQIWSEMARAST